jgi:hypothetical protein
MTPKNYSAVNCAAIGARVGFETPSFEIVINAASRVILNSAVHRLSTFLKREDYYDKYVHSAS